MKKLFCFFFLTVIEIVVAKHYSSTPRYVCHDEDSVLQGRRCVRKQFSSPTIRCQLELGDLFEDDSFRKDCSKVNLNDNQRNFFLEKFFKSMNLGSLKDLDSNLLGALEKDGFNIDALKNLDVDLLQNFINNIDLDVLKKLDFNLIKTFLENGGLNGDSLKNIDLNLLINNNKDLGDVNSLRDVFVNFVGNSKPNFNILMKTLDDNLLRRHVSNNCSLENCLGDETRLKNNQCVSVDFIDPKMKCENGGSLVGDKCTTVVPPRQICPPGFLSVFSKNNIDRCIKNPVFNPMDNINISRCPNEYVPTNGKCYFKKIFQPEMKCPNGYQLQHNFCSLLQQSQIGQDFTSIPWRLPSRRKPEIVCPDGAYLENERCRIENVLPMGNYNIRRPRKKIVKPIVGCDDGYTLDDTICIKIDIAVKSCPPEFKLENNKCKREDFYPPVLQCPPNFQFSNNKCIFTVENNSLPNCPAPYKTRRNKCVLF